MSIRRWFRRQFGRLWLRLLLVNAIVLLVPVAGLSFARVFERELLRSLERDMRHQAVLTHQMLAADPAELFSIKHEQVLSRAAIQTRTRIRVLDQSGELRLDSHRQGPPEGKEKPPPRQFPNLDGASISYRRTEGRRWPALAQRREVVSALAGKRGAATRIRRRDPSVILFLSEPIQLGAEVAGVVYVTRSTRPVMVELYRIRESLKKVLLVAFVLTGAATLWLAWSITRPLARLSRAATTIAAGKYDEAIPTQGAGEVGDLARALAKMTLSLKARVEQTKNFAADVAHGFKTPLTSLRGAAELLTQGAEDDPSTRSRFIRNIEIDAERLDRLVTRLLQLSRLETSDEPVAQFDIMELLLRVVERSSTPDVEVRLSSTCKSCLVAGRRSDLEAAFANLLDNAVKFAPPNTSVEVTAQSKSDQLVLSIRDQGPGISEASRPRLFERFFTTDTEYGTGLGLAIVKTVLEAHGGTVALAESPPPGAHFIVTLPLLSPAAPI